MAHTSSSACQSLHDRARRLAAILLLQSSNFCVLQRLNHDLLLSNDFVLLLNCLEGILKSKRIKTGTHEREIAACQCHGLINTCDAVFVRLSKSVHRLSCTAKVFSVMQKLASLSCLSRGVIQGLLNCFHQKSTYSELWMDPINGWQVFSPTGQVRFVDRNASRRSDVAYSNSLQYGKLNRVHDVFSTVVVDCNLFARVNITQGAEFLDLSASVVIPCIGIVRMVV